MTLLQREGYRKKRVGVGYLVLVLCLMSIYYRFQEANRIFASDQLVSIGKEQFSFQEPNRIFASEQSFSIGEELQLPTIANQSEKEQLFSIGKELQLPTIANQSEKEQLFSIGKELRLPTIANQSEKEQFSSIGKELELPAIANQSEKEQHAIIIPYRNRSYHLAEFMAYMRDYLQDNFPKSEFSLWIIEQNDDELFNRAWLTNVGVKEILAHNPKTQCITLHDVDLVPDNNLTSGVGIVPYDVCTLPTQLGSELQHFKWGVPYDESFGGVCSMHADHWLKINGMSNMYAGWGGEDDDLLHRIRVNGLTVGKRKLPNRPPKGHGIFRTISQAEIHHPPKKINGDSYKMISKILDEMKRGSQRWKSDGLSDLFYFVDSRTDLVDEKGGFGEIHRLKVRQNLLEFVHIAKTAGSAIEKAGAKAGIAWGACHFHHALEKEMGCPSPPNFEGIGLFSKKPSWRGISLWHVPHQMWNLNVFVSKKTFCVVRNPFARMVSIYYDKWEGYKGANRNDPKTLNSFIQNMTATESKHINSRPQVDYVYDRDKKVVDHILKFENLGEDFADLMARYNLTSVALEAKAYNKRERDALLSVRDLTEKTVSMIRDHYKLDFERFNYSLTTPPVESVE
jgi:hypothetical protein